MLSSNTRQQVRRSLRGFEAVAGPLVIQAATTVTEALDTLAVLAALHQKGWTARGKPGVFASTKFFNFHRQLIGRTFDKGFVHLLRAQAGSQTIGVLYNFFYQGRVYFYQSGLEQQSDSRLKPGMTTHFLAVNHYLRERPEALEYDFLAGDSQYKRSLASRSRGLQWIVASAPSSRVRLLGALREWKRKFAKGRE